MRRLLPLLFPLLLLGACGFHLRGSLPRAEADSVSSVYINERRAGDVAREVRAQLRAAEVTVAAAADTAEYILTLDNARVDRNVLSVSAQTGKAEEYQLLLTLRMSVRRGEATLVDNELVEVARDYTFDEDAVLGKYSEEQVLEEEMTRRAADRIIRRLNAAARNE
jgi:LPS-assembly lipoprotein